jgi:peptidyl-tRNA hydrolase
MNLNKICPYCDTEYLPHIEKCTDCGAVLLRHEEYGKAQEEKKRTAEKTVEDRAVVREGDLDWLTELRAVLIDTGIPSTIHSDAGCGKGCCGDTCRLVVSPADLERAQESIEEYFMEVNPELRASNELLREGKCPACGAPVGTGARECPDCGLPLLIVEEEED